jgi:hypothetical protein
MEKAPVRMEICWTFTTCKFTVRLKNVNKTVVLPTNANLLNWLPGDIVHDENLYIRFDMQPGKFQIEIMIVSPVSHESRIFKQRQNRLAKS